MSAPPEPPTGVTRAQVPFEGVRAATRRLLETIDDLTDEQARRGTLVPDWTRAEVLTHLARNAEGLCRMAEAAERGEVAAQYPGGAAQRAADIARGHDTGAAALRTDVRRASDHLMEVWSRLPAEAWNRSGDVIDGTRTIAHTVWSRWREVEIHHLDLDLGYAPADWPVAFVQRALPERLSMLTRGDAAVDAGELRARLDGSDLDQAWMVAVRGRAAEVAEVPTGTGGSLGDDAIDAVVSGWGCDLLAWLYGRDPRANELTITGVARVVELPEWFPFT
jgi:maleylpyruvate isomerase